MWLLLSAVLLQPPTTSRPAVPTEWQIIQAEHGRPDDISVLAAGTRSPDVRLQRLAVRAIGRLERPELASAVELSLRAPDPLVRMEAVNALGQMNAPYAWGSLLTNERDGRVRGVVYETVGRVRSTPDSAEALLTRGLGESSVDARAGAARGLESLIRRTGRTARPVEATVLALRRAALDASREPIGVELRENALLALAAAGDRDSATANAALRDPSEQVRRVAVSIARRFVDDPSYIVRLQALRYAGSCERLIAATADREEHVVLAAIDSLGGRACDRSALTRLSDAGRTWRMAAHAIVSLAKQAPDSARARVVRLARSPVWQARTYAVAAARVLGDSATLATLARDREPNVAIAAMRNQDDAMRALGSNHAGLIMAGVDQLAGNPVRTTALPAPVIDAMLTTLDRLSATGRVTVRDPREKILTALAKQTDSTRIIPRLRARLSDPDPVVAAAAAAIISAFRGPSGAVSPATRKYTPPPLPSQAFVRALRGATAELRVRGIGTVTMQLLTDDATVTVATFAALADSGRFNGLTFHRIVPNFVVQGASPGADEYDALTTWFMRDELGLTRNSRGTFGTSTRGRDTGDGQIFINLIDNFRLDHDYT
ncbi:MAG: HEAT repeat domain-containing protein, partial [Gemmatimonadota bacterium]